MGYYVSPKVELRKSTIGGKGLFAKSAIRRNEVLVKYLNGPAKLVDLKEAIRLYKRGFDYMIEVGDNLFLAATKPKELTDADHLNHSCDPNCGIKGELTIVAMRNINAGEEITFDYAMSESLPYKMKCHCDSKSCRKIITGNDWRRKDLQKKYRGFFANHVQRKIDALRK